MPNVRALILDPTYRSKNSAGPLCDLARDHFSWSFSQFSFEETQVSDPRPILSRVRTALEEADVLIGLGNFFIFAWLGDGYGDEYVKLVQDRMRAGMPALFQLPRFFDGLRTGQIAARTELIFRGCDVLSTNNRVYSDQDSYTGHSSPMSPWFRKADGCLLNPEIFTGIDSILMSSVNLLDYAGDTFPIVEAGPLHLFVDDRDYPSNGVLGQKNAVAVLRRTAIEFSIFLGGSALDAPTETFGGTLPGIEANPILPVRLLQALHDATQGNRYLNDAYASFSRLERDLGKLISDVLSKASNGNSIEQYFPAHVKDHTNAKGGISFSLANYDDLTDIILENWDLFQPVFIETSKNQVKRQLQRLNYKYRRHLAHPHKAEQEGFIFKSADVDAIRDVHATVQSAMRNKPVA
jgi:hypothetical protein